jgi:hypothetical protein
MSLAPAEVLSEHPRHTDKRISELWLRNHVLFSMRRERGPSDHRVVAEMDGWLTKRMIRWSPGRRLRDIDSRRERLLDGL